MKKKDILWEKVKKDFPEDPALQEVHYARLKIHQITRKMRHGELIQYFKTFTRSNINLSKT